MGGLRNLEKECKQYQMLMDEHEEWMKEQKEEYFIKVKILIGSVKEYADSIEKKYQDWYHKETILLENVPNNILERITKKIQMAIVDYFLNSHRYKLEKVEKIKDFFEKVLIRLKQFMYIG